jgi:hypothetical protein
MVNKEYNSKLEKGNKMKVTVITGSAHKKGTSAMLADKFIEGALQAGHEVFRLMQLLKKLIHV